MEQLPKNKKRIVLGVTASIAAYKVCGLITEMKRAGYFVRVVMTRDADHFVTPLALQSLSGQEVVRDFFSLTHREKPIHIDLAENSDLLLIAPATADIIARMASGLADDVLTCIALATQAPILVAPAMNEKMYLHPATQNNIERLKSFGVKFIPPIEGYLACGSKGVGHIADPDTILKSVRECLSA